MPVRALPTVDLRGRTWTVDERLREIRFADPEVGMEFVSFDDLTMPELEAIHKVIPQRHEYDTHREQLG